MAAADRRWGPGGGGRDAPSFFSSSRRRRRPPAWEWEGGFVGLALRAGGSLGRRLQLLLRLSRRPAREPRAPAWSTHALLPLRPRGFPNHRPRPLQPVGRRWPRESDQAQRRMRAPRGHVTANRRAPGIYKGRGTRAPGRHLLRRGWGGVVTPATKPRKGSGTKDLHVLGSLRREARKPAAPSFCNHSKPFPVFAGEGGSERVLMNGKARTEVARFSLQIVLGGGCF